MERRRYVCVATVRAARQRLDGQRRHRQHEVVVRVLGKVAELDSQHRTPDDVVVADELVLFDLEKQIADATYFHHFVPRGLVVVRRGVAAGGATVGGPGHRGNERQTDVQTRCAFAL